MKDWNYASKGTIKANVQDLALDAIAEVLWGEVYKDDSKKLSMIEGIMMLAAGIDEDMTENEVEHDAQAGN